MFSFGTFTRAGPTAQQIAETSFTSTLYCKGFTSKDAADNGDPDAEVKVQVSGPEPGYVTTPICVVNAAYSFLDANDSKNIPFGVHTPSSAFTKTTFIKRLHKRNVKFEVIDSKL